MLLGGLPLAVYPFCLLANVMSLAGHQEQPLSPLVVATTYAFLWSSTLYPVVYLPSPLAAAFFDAGGRDLATRRVAYVPLVYLTGITLLLWVHGFASL